MAGQDMAAARQAAATNAGRRAVEDLAVTGRRPRASGATIAAEPRRKVDCAAIDASSDLTADRDPHRADFLRTALEVYIFTCVCCIMSIRQQVHSARPASLPQGLSSKADQKPAFALGASRPGGRMRAAATGAAPGRTGIARMT
jgi:hypothetical protein